MDMYRYIYIYIHTYIYIYTHTHTYIHTYCNPLALYLGILLLVSSNEVGAHPCLSFLDARPDALALCIEERQEKHAKKKHRAHTSRAK